MRSPYRLLGLTLFPLLRHRIYQLSGLEHLPKSGGFIIAANHQSWIDSLMLAAAVYDCIPASLRFVAQSSKYRFLGGIPIDEYDKGRVIDIAYGYLKAGHPIVIFPEGNSNKNPELRTGKTGAARLALRSGLPVIPVGIQGTEGIKGWQAMGWFWQLWKPCRINIGSSLTFPKTELTAVDHDRLMTVTSEIMQRISHYSGKPYMVGSDTKLQEKTAGWVKRFLQTAAVTWLNRRLRLAGTEHLPLHGPYIVAGNHSSYFDGIALSAALVDQRKTQPYYLTKGSLAAKWRKILGSRVFEIFGMLPIDGEDKSKVLDAAVQHLNHGGVIGIFPEGTRNKPKINPDWQTTMLKGKTGVARLWLATKVPIIPCGIKAPQGITMAQTLFNALIWWRPIMITFGPPVNIIKTTTDKPSKQDLEDITRMIMHRVSELSGLKYPY